MAAFSVNDKIEMRGKDGIWYAGSIYEVQDDAIFVYLLPPLGWHVKVTINEETPPIRKGWK